MSSHQHSSNKSNNLGCNIGCAPFSLGGIVSSILSHKLNASIGWMIAHACCGLIYTVYALIFRYSDVSRVIAKLLG